MHTQCVSDESNGKIEVQTFGSSQLGKDKELLQKLKLGQVDFALPSSVMSSVADEFGVFEMPYIIKDRDHMKRVQDKLGTRSRRRHRQRVTISLVILRTDSVISPTTLVRLTFPPTSKE